MYNHDGSSIGVYNQEQQGTLFGGSGYDSDNGEFFDHTILFPRAYESDHQLALTLTHEAYGHQFLNNHDEFLAEAHAVVCGTEN